MARGDLDDLPGDDWGAGQYGTDDIADAVRHAVEACQTISRLARDLT